MVNLSNCYSVILDEITMHMTGRAESEVLEKVTSA